MNEAEWLACDNPTAMLGPVRETASDRKLGFFSVLCQWVLCPITSGDLEVYKAFEQALLSNAPGPALRVAAEQFAGYWEFDGTLWGFANYMAVRHAGHHPDKIRSFVLEVFGNPFRPVDFPSGWRTSTSVALASQMYESRTFDAMPILADALQDAGCNSDDILDHCRDPKQVHVRGCWVADLVLGKE
ncbi:Uncharacterized protein (Fragment) OS=uncultured bacterium PE=4 SV=1 [Gemmata massiliana]|uniref:Uncharacterized protein n=1 Tax=Gemmata massiliana TaxID=1210884 RepID=A0A6P2CTV2_9BACT